VGRFLGGCPADIPAGGGGAGDRVGPESAEGSLGEESVWIRGVDLGAAGVD
jgi:hypothetical protein